MNPEEKINVSPENNVETPEATTKAKEKKDPTKLYPSRLSKFSSFYIGLVVLAAAGLGLSIYLAIENDLLWAAVAALLTVFCYVRFSASEMNEKLGLSYRTSAGSLTITACRPRYGDILYIPSRLLWYDVEEIDDGAFKSKKNSELREVYFPKSLKRIGKDIFVKCENLECVNFEGTKEEWDAIEKKTDFEGLKLSFNAKYPTLPSKEKAKK